MIFSIVLHNILLLRNINIQYCQLYLARDCLRKGDLKETLVLICYIRNCTWDKY